MEKMKKLKKVDPNVPRPFTEIADRIRWHRGLMGLNQVKYAENIGHARSIYSLWESGTYRVSLDGALSLRKTHGLSLDFIYEGNSDALSITLRQAWNDRS